MKNLNWDPRTTAILIVVRIGESVYQIDKALCLELETKLI